MRHEPSSAIGAKRQVSPKLVGANSFLAGAQQVYREKPLVQGNLAVLKDRADRYRKWLTASGAFVDAFAERILCASLRLQLVRLPDHATVRANRSFRPQLLFEVRTGAVFVSELRLK